MSNNGEKYPTARVWVSEVAALIGKHPYRDACAERRKIAKRSGLLLCDGTPTKTERVKAIADALLRTLPQSHIKKVLENARTGSEAAAAMPSTSKVACLIKQNETMDGKTHMNDKTNDEEPLSCPDCDMPVHASRIICKECKCRLRPRCPVDGCKRSLRNSDGKCKDHGRPTAHSQHIDPQEVSRQIKQNMAMEFGKYREAPDLRKFEATSKHTVINMQKYCGIEQKTENGNIFMLNGMVDGMQKTLDGEKVVETKSRMFKLFGHVRDYEMIQIQMYMHLTGCQSGTLIETYGDEQAAYDVLYNKDFATDIIARVGATVDEIYSEHIRALSER